jgi:glycine dehydrogenase
MKRFIRRLSSIYSPLDTFPKRHIGPEDVEVGAMLNVLKLSSLDELVSKTVPKEIHVIKATRLGHGISESEVIMRLGEIAHMNQNFKSYLGMGYCGI